jgi:RNA polymerase sigma-70 factor (ECF subfamily)
LRLYDALVTITSTLSAQLGRLAILAKLEGPESALSELNKLLATNPKLSDYQPYQALRCHLLNLAGDRDGAIGAAKLAGSLTDVPSVREFFADKVRRLQ